MNVLLSKLFKKGQERENFKFNINAPDFSCSHYFENVAGTRQYFSLCVSQFEFRIPKRHFSFFHQQKFPNDNVQPSCIFYQQHRSLDRQHHGPHLAAGSDSIILR